MNLLIDLLEALKPSQYRRYVKGWDKSKYEDMFRKYAQDRKAYRIYIPLKGEPKNVEPDSEVKAAVEAAGYVIEDYVSGIASKDEGKRKIKIGKLLKDPKLQQKFANDPKRASAKNVENFVVISRHPYDIAGMSTDRGWRSCMNLKDGINKHYVPLDIKEGSLVAYLVRADDKNINNPIARVLIKTFINTDKNAEEGKKVAFGVEDRIYGTPMSGFRETVLKWVDEVNDSRGLDGIFKFNDNLYNDGGTKDFIGVGPSGKTYQMIKDDPMSIEKVENPSPELVKMAVDKSHGQALRVLKTKPEDDLITRGLYMLTYGYNTKEENSKVIKHVIEMGWTTAPVRKELLRRHPEALTMLPNITDQDYILAIDASYSTFPKICDTLGAELENKLSWKVITYGLNHDAEDMSHIVAPSPKLQKWYMEHHPHYIQYIKNPDLDLLKDAVKKDHKIIRNIPKKFVTDELVQIAFDQDPNHIHHFDKPTDEHVKKALDHNISNLRHVDEKHHTQERHDQALDQNTRNVEYLKNMSESTMMKYLDKGGTYYHLYKAKSEGRIKEKIPESVMLKAIEKAEGSIEDIVYYMKDAGKAIQEIAIKKDPNTITMFRDPDPELTIQAIKKNPDIYHQLGHISHEIARAILKIKPAAIRWVDDPTESELISAIVNEPRIIGKLEKKHLTDKLVALAASKSWRALETLDDDDWPKFPEIVQLAAAKNFNPNEKDSYDYVEDFANLFKKSPSPKMMMAILKKKPEILAEFPIENWTKEQVEYAMTNGTHEEHVRIYNMLADVRKIHKSRTFRYGTSHIGHLDMRKKFDKEFMDRMKVVALGKKEEKKAREAAQKARMSIKLQFWKDKSDPKYKKLWDVVKKHKPVEDMEISMSYDLSYGNMPGQSTYKRRYASYVRNLLGKTYYDSDKHRQPPDDWEFDEAWVLPLSKKFKTHTPVVGFFKSGEVVGYVNMKNGLAWHPTKEGHTPPHGMHQEEDDLQESKKRTSFKDMLNETK